MDKADRIGPACSPRAEFPGPGHSFVPPKQALMGADGPDSVEVKAHCLAQAPMGAGGPCARLVASPAMPQALRGAGGSTATQCYTRSRKKAS